MNQPSKQSNRVVLPDFFRPIMWSYDWEQIELERDKKMIILNTVNYGDLKHWRWLSENFGREEIKRTFKEVPASAVRPPALKLATLIFSLENLNYAPRGVE